MSDFLAFWFRECTSGCIEIGSLVPGTTSLSVFERFGLEQIEEAAEYAAATNAKPGASIYFRASTINPAAREGRTTDADVRQAPGLWTDHDSEESVQLLSQNDLPIKPAGWTVTGTIPHLRVQAFWPLTEPLIEPDMIRDLNHRLIAKFRCDSTTYNPSRLMRLPGSIAWPVKKGRTTAEVTTWNIAKDGRPKHLPLHQVAFVLPKFSGASAPSPAAETEAVPDFGGASRVSDLLRRLHEPEMWHKSVLRLIAHWVGRGWSNAEILAMAEHVTLPGFQVADTRADLVKMAAGAREKWGVADLEHTVGEKEGPAEPFAGAIFDPWEALTPVAFPMDALPPALGAFAASRATAIGCDPAAVAMSCMSALSAALDGRSKLKMKRFDSWTVPPALWVALIGPSSAKKSPAIKAAWSPLEKRQAVSLRAHNAREREWKNAPKEIRGDEPRPPPRLVSHDATMEAIQGILGNQDRGLGVLRDELAGFIGQMDKYSNGKGGAADRAFFLQAFEGGSYVADRVGRGTVPIENLLLAICGGIQPDRLASFSDLTDDGLWQRFLPIIMAPPSMGQDIASGEAEEAYDAIVEHVIGLPALLAYLSPEARNERERMERKLFDLEQSDMLGGAFTSFVGKLNGIWGRLALVLHAADPSSIPSEVSGTHAAGASALVDYMIKSAARVYLSMGAPGGKGPQPIKEIAGYLLVKKSRRILASDLTSGVRLCRGLSLDEIQKALSPLVAGNWLNPEKPFPHNNAWAVNPAVHETFAPRAVSEAARRQRLREETIDRRKGSADEAE